MDLYPLLRFAKVLGVAALFTGSAGAVMARDLADRRRFAFALAGPGLGVTWGVGAGLAAVTGVSLLSWWILGAIALSLFILATFAAAGFVIVGLAYASRVFSMRDAGLIAGIGAGSWSAFVALLMPVFGRLFDRHAYGAAFALASAAPVVGLLAWGAIDRSATRGRRRRSSAR